MRAYWGLTRALINNMIVGVTEGYQKKLEIVGVGWGAKLQGKQLQLNVGYCEPRLMAVPDVIELAVEKGSQRSKISRPLIKTTSWASGQRSTNWT